MWKAVFRGDIQNFSVPEAKRKHTLVISVPSLRSLPLLDLTAGTGSLFHVRPHFSRGMSSLEDLLPFKNF